jgi:DNA-binding response OmpR family regulator
MNPPTALSVLCVDDDADTRELLDIYLSSLGLKVTLAATANEALRHNETTVFDLYLLDAWLPDIDGFELCRQVRERTSRSNPILFFSGAAREIDKQKGIEAGANAYVSKPNFGEFMDTVSNLIAETTGLKIKANKHTDSLSMFG